MVRSTSGARSWRRRVRVKRFGKEGDRVRRRHRLGQRARVVPRRVGLQRRLLGRARQIEHVAAGGFDEQRFLGAEVIGDLAWKRVGGRRDVGDRGAGEAPLPEQAGWRASSSRERIWRPAVRRRAAAACLGSPARTFPELSGRTWEPFCPPTDYLYDIQTNKSTDRRVALTWPRPYPRKPCQRAAKSL